MVKDRKYHACRRAHPGCCSAGLSFLTFLFCCSTFPCTVSSYVRSAHEGHFPYVTDTISGRSVVWSRGSLLQHVLGSAAVRMTDNRVRFIPAGWTLIPFIRDDLPFAPCKPCAEALCQVQNSQLMHSVGVGAGSMIFPIARTPVIVHGNTTHVCKNGVGRHSEASDREGTRYDISVCDVVDGPIDVLFTHDRVCPGPLGLNAIIFSLFCVVPFSYCNLLHGPLGLNAIIFSLFCVVPFSYCNLLHGVVTFLWLQTYSCHDLCRFT